MNHTIHIHTNLDVPEAVVLMALQDGFTIEAFLIDLMKKKIAEVQWGIEDNAAFEERWSNSTRLIRPE